jgi:phosphatidate cytidylyltransferase
VFALILVLSPFDSINFIKSRAVLVPMGFLVLVPLWVSIVRLHSISPALLFYVVCLTCFGDTGAYFVGKKYGKHKLAPVLSPKKTIEGLFGGLVVGGIAGFIVSLFFNGYSMHQFAFLYAIGVFIMLISVMGDLFESLLKRKCDIKDSGNILPGHGGILDRVDSLSVSMPVFALLYLSMVH